MKLNETAGSPLFEKDAQGQLLHPMYEYMLVLQPHEALREKIMQVKKQFGETYRTTASMYVGPQVMLVNFMQHQQKEDRIVQRLQTIAMGYQPVKIELKDYGSFPSHTIFIQVTSKLPIQQLVKTIRTEAQLLMKLDKENKPHFMMEPHIPIARKLQPWQYEKGWLEYSHRQFTGRFIADAMLLLKRKPGDTRFQILRRMEFQNLPIHTTQGALFM